MCVNYAEILKVYVGRRFRVSLTISSVDSVCDLVQLVVCACFPAPLSAVDGEMAAGNGLYGDLDMVLGGPVCLHPQRHAARYPLQNKYGLATVRGQSFSGNHFSTRLCSFNQEQCPAKTVFAMLSECMRPQVYVFCIT